MHNLNIVLNQVVLFEPFLELNEMMENFCIFIPGIGAKKNNSIAEYLLTSFSFRFKHKQIVKWTINKYKIKIFYLRNQNGN